MKRTVLTGIALLAGLAANVLQLGCNVSGRRVEYVTSPETTTRLAKTGGGVDLALAQRHEIDLVESVLEHRSEYQRQLRMLQDYYVEKGFDEKAAWATKELRGFQTVMRFRYLMDAEVPSDLLRPVDRVTEADAMYERGLDLMKRGGHGIPALFREDRMIQSAEVFRSLIQQYPSSDKIDDAAFYLGEIHKEYLRGQESIAVKWYERAWTWNPATPHPARFQAAVVYDYRLHDRDQALELYQAVLDHEASIPSNVRWASRRIGELIASEQTAIADRP